MDKELEAIVQRMMDAGEPDEKIDLVINNWDTRQIPHDANTSASDAPPANTSLAPGILTGAGMTVAGAGKAAPHIVKSIGSALQKPMAQKAVKHTLGLAGGAVGGSMGSALGGPVGGYIGVGTGGAVGYKAGKSVTGKMGSIGEMLSNAPAAAKYEPFWGDLGSSLKGTQLLGKGLRGFGKAAGPIGIGLTILDLINMGGPAILDALRERGQQFRTGDPNAPLGDLAPRPSQTASAAPDEEMLQQLLLRISPTASH